jgi:hypothetical protein
LTKTIALSISRRSFFKSTAALLAAVSIGAKAQGLVEAHSLSCTGATPSGCTSCYGVCSCSISEALNCCSPNGVYCSGVSCTCTCPWCLWFRARFIMCNDGHSLPCCIQGC